MTVALIDDAALGAVLRGSTPPRLRRRTLATTGLWYVRLCQAVLSPRELRGTLSLPFANLDESQRQRALAALVRLPDHVQLLGLRELGPVMGRLRGEQRLNLLSTEVLAAAEALDAVVCLSAPSPKLEQALAQSGRPYFHL